MRGSPPTSKTSPPSEALAGLGVAPERIYVDHGLTRTTRARPGLREALAACHDGDTLVVTKLDRLARSLPDARDIADELTARQVKLNLGGSVHDPTDPVGRLLFNVLAMIAEFEADLIRMRTREGMKVARAKGRRQAAEAQPPPGSPPRHAPQRRNPYQRRAGRAVLRRPLDGLPGDPTGWLTGRPPCRHATWRLVPRSLAPPGDRRGRVAAPPIVLPGVRCYSTRRRHSNGCTRRGV
jgi:Resolvase, N terminal domain